MLSARSPVPGVRERHDLHHATAAGVHHARCWKPLLMLPMPRPRTPARPRGRPIDPTGAGSPICGGRAPPRRRRRAMSESTPSASWPVFLGGGASRRPPPGAVQRGASRWQADWSSRWRPQGVDGFWGGTPMRAASRSAWSPALDDVRAAPARLRRARERSFRACRTGRWAGGCCRPGTGQGLGRGERIDGSPRRGRDRRIRRFLCADDEAAG